VKAPLEDGKGVVLRTFRGTEVGVDEREELRKEGILLDCNNMGPVDPRKLLSGLVRLGTESRSVGMDPVGGNAGDCKSGGVTSIVKKNLKERDEERKKRMKEVDGRTVRNRVRVTNVMRQHANDGLAYKGKVLEHSKHTRALKTWAFKIETLGNAGVDTGRHRKFPVSPPYCRKAPAAVAVQDRHQVPLRFHRAAGSCRSGGACAGARPGMSRWVSSAVGPVMVSLKYRPG
jgi:hypothetical protein